MALYILFAPIIIKAVDVLWKTYGKRQMVIVEAVWVTMLCGLEELQIS